MYFTLQKMNKKGFLLVSFLVYLLLFSVVVCQVSLTITNILFPVIVNAKKYNAIVRIYNATDIIVGDLRNNPVKRWKKNSPNEIIWQTNEKDVGWAFDGTNLERREGIYKEEWKKCTRSIIPCTVSSVVFTPDYGLSKDSYLVGITVE